MGLVYRVGHRPGIFQALRGAPPGSQGSPVARSDPALARARYGRRQTVVIALRGTATLEGGGSLEGNPAKEERADPHWDNSSMPY